jgi:uncharacterized protein
MKILTRFLLLTLVALTVGCSAPNEPSISLYLAMQRGDVDQIDRHIHWGSDMNALMADGKRPLHVAAELGRVVIVRKLLKHGADIDAPSAEGDSALDLAVLNGRIQTAELLLEHGADLDATRLLLRVAQTGVTDRDVVRFLIGHGADSEARGEDGETPLIIAIRQGNHRLVAHLIKQGSNVNAETADGLSALELARELRFPELVSRLERYGAR